MDQQLLKLQLMQFRRKKEFVEGKKLSSKKKQLSESQKNRLKKHIHSKLGVQPIKPVHLQNKVFDKLSEGPDTSSKKPI